MYVCALVIAPLQEYTVVVVVGVETETVYTDTPQFVTMFTSYSSSIIVLTIIFILHYLVV